MEIIDLNPEALLFKELNIIKLFSKTVILYKHLGFNVDILTSDQ